MLVDESPRLIVNLPNHLMMDVPRGFLKSGVPFWGFPTKEDCNILESILRPLPYSIVDREPRGKEPRNLMETGAIWGVVGGRWTGAGGSLYGKASDVTTLYVVNNKAVSGFEQNLSVTCKRNSPATRLPANCLNRGPRSPPDANDPTKLT